MSFKFPNEILTIIGFFKKFPGVGKKTAQRFAFHLLNWSQEDIEKFSKEIENLKANIHSCNECGCLMDQKVCHYCNFDKRDSQILCIISSPKDVYAIEETHTYKGLYHVIGGLLSPIEGKTLNPVLLKKLIQRIETLDVKEIIIALDSTLEGDATALYLKQELNSLNVGITRLAFGLPLGSSLDYIDEGTLSQALKGRQVF